MQLFSLMPARSAAEGRFAISDLVRLLPKAAEEIISRLVALNRERAREEERGQVRWLRIRPAVRAILVSLSRVGEVSTGDRGKSFARRLLATGYASSTSPMLIPLATIRCVTSARSRREAA